MPNAVTMTHLSSAVPAQFPVRCRRLRLHVLTQKSDWCSLDAPQQRVLAVTVFFFKQSRYISMDVAVLYYLSQFPLVVHGSFYISTGWLLQYTSTRESMLE